MIPGKGFPVSESTEIQRMISPAQLKGIEGYADALNLLAQTYGLDEIESAADALGDGFALTDNKDQFIGVPMIFVHWTVSDGDFPDEETGELGKFVTARVVTSAGKFVITDGGHGIGKQLRAYSEETGKTFIRADHGLSVSTYSNQWTDKGRTYYIDTSA